MTLLGLMVAFSSWVAGIALGYGACAWKEHNARQRGGRRKNVLRMRWDETSLSFVTEGVGRSSDYWLMRNLFRYGIGMPTTEVSREKLLESKGVDKAVNKLRMRLAEADFNPDTLQISVEAR